MARNAVLSVEKMGSDESRPSFVLSTVAMIFGGFMLACGAMGFVNERTLVLRTTFVHGMSAYGLPALFGALAYRSAKRRRLNLVRSSISRVMAEGALIGTALLPQLLAMIFSPKGFLPELNRDPAPVLVSVVWVLAAYYAARTGFTIRNLFTNAGR